MQQMLYIPLNRLHYGHRAQPVKQSEPISAQGRL